MNDAGDHVIVANVAVAVGGFVADNAMEARKVYLPYEREMLRQVHHK